MAAPSESSPRTSIVAAVGVEDAHDHAQRGRLARAVGADEAVDRPLGDGQRQVVDGDVVAEGLRHPLDLDGGHKAPVIAEFRRSGSSRSAAARRSPRHDSSATPAHLLRIRHHEVFVRPILPRIQGARRCPTPKTRSRKASTTPPSKAKEATDKAAHKASEAAEDVGQKVKDAGQKIKDAGH